MELVVAPTELGRCTRSCIQWKPRSKWTKKLIKFVQFQTLDHRFIFLYHEGLSECWSGKIFCVSRLVTEQWGIVIIIIKKKAVVPFQFSLDGMGTDPWFRGQQSNGKLGGEKDMSRWFASSIKGLGDTSCPWRTQAVSLDIVTTITQRHFSARFLTEMKSQLLNEPRVVL